MATVLIAWELGSGLGHLMRLKPIVQGLVRRGHHVIASVKDVVCAHRVLDDPRVSLLPSLTATVPAYQRIKSIRSFAHILHNSGFGDRDTLAAMLGAQRRLLDLIRPDLIVCDHSPITLLASRGFSARRISIGTGFCCPPVETPFRDLRPEATIEQGQLQREENQVLQTINSVLVEMRLKQLDYLAELYREVDATILTTFRELDHYTNRPDAEYWGTWSENSGINADWPNGNGNGKRVFAYIKPFQAFPALINKLNAIGCPTIIYAKGLSNELRQRLASPTIQFMSGQVDLAQVGESCDLAILNGGHGATASLLLSGKPILQIPHYLEQSMTAQAVTRMHAGLGSSSKDPVTIEHALDTLLSDESYSKGAQCFAKRHKSHDAEKAVNRALELCESLL